MGTLEPFIGYVKSSWVSFLLNLVRWLAAALALFLGFRCMSLSPLCINWMLKRVLKLTPKKGTEVSRKRNSSAKERFLNEDGIPTAGFVDTDPTLTDFVLHFTQAGIRVGMVFIAAGIANVSTESLAVFVSMFVLAMGLAVRGILQDFVCGFMLIFLRPFHVGALVKFDGGNWTSSGFVDTISLSKSVLRKADGEVIFVPNKLLMDSVIYCLNDLRLRRVDINFNMSYNNDHLLVKEVLLKRIHKLPDVLSDPPPQVLITSLDEHGIGFSVRVWVDVDNLLKTPFLVRRLTVHTFKRNGFTFYAVGMAPRPLAHPHAQKQMQDSSSDDELCPDMFTQDDDD